MLIVAITLLSLMLCALLFTLFSAHLASLALLVVVLLGCMVIIAAEIISSYRTEHQER